MPYREIWVDPELFLSHNGVNVYRTYSNDDFDGGANIYRFTVKPMEAEGFNEAFDVRGLKVPSSSLLDAHPPFISLSMPEEKKQKLLALWNDWQGPDGEIQVVRLVLKEAIEAGLIVAGEDNVIENEESETELDWEVIGKSMKAANISGDIMPCETESQFVARIIDELHNRRIQSSQDNDGGMDAAIVALIDRCGGSSGRGCHQYTREDWVYEVNEGNTRLCYWEWVIHQAESDEVELEDLTGKN